MTEVIERRNQSIPENVVFDAKNLIKVDCYSNEYAAELRADMHRMGMQTIETQNPRLVIGIIGREA